MQFRFINLSLVALAVCLPVLSTPVSPAANDVGELIKRYGDGEVVKRDQEYDDCFNRAFNFGFECFWENYCPWYGGHCPCPGGDGTNCGNGEWTGCKAGQAAAQNAKCGGPIW